MKNYETFLKTKLRKDLKALLRKNSTELKEEKYERIVDDVMNRVKGDETLKSYFNKINECVEMANNEGEGKYLELVTHWQKLSEHYLSKRSKPLLEHELKEATEESINKLPPLRLKTEDDKVFFE